MSHIKMGDVILIWKMFKIHFLIILYKLQVMGVFYIAPNVIPNVIPSSVILNQFFTPCIGLTKTMRF